MFSDLGSVYIEDANEGSTIYFSRKEQRTQAQKQRQKALADRKDAALRKKAKAHETPEGAI